MNRDLQNIMSNLFTNAFYSVNEKKKAPQLTNRGIEYEQIITTKPTGRGTGPGSSLTYDITAKKHCRTITAKTKENGFAEFAIELHIRSWQGTAYLLSHSE